MPTEQTPSVLDSKLVSTISGNNRIHYDPMVVFFCLQITIDHYHHYANISEGNELLKRQSGTFCVQCVSKIKSVQLWEYMFVFLLPSSNRKYDHLPLFSVRSCNYGTRCMFFSYSCLWYSPGVIIICSHSALLQPLPNSPIGRKYSAHLETNRWSDWEQIWWTSHAFPVTLNPPNSDIPLIHPSPLFQSQAGDSHPRVLSCFSMAQFA